MSQLARLRAATSLRELATLLGFQPAALSFVLYKKDSAIKYTKFEIPKRYGGVRQINAPTAELKLLQRRLSDLLQSCIDEIAEAAGEEDQISHGFKPKRSIITNAKNHRNKRYVFNIDLKDFFGTINFGRVRGFFIKDKSFALNDKVATVIAQIACHENSLPQGSPCSPVISNLIGHVLDMHLVKLAYSSGCTYSRYADDLTFSTNKRKFPIGIASRVEGIEHNWILGNNLEHLIEMCGFETNPLKTRMQYCDSRQEVTGLVVNTKINVRREYRHVVRAMADSLFKTGKFEFIYKTKNEKGEATEIRIDGSPNQLHGMLGFIDGVDLYNRKALQQPKSPKDRSSITSKESLYRRFLLYKEFYAATAPVIICEGKTDNVYLLHAIRSLAKAYPRLATIGDDGKVKLNVRLYKNSGTSTGRILGLTGGASILAKFILDYAQEMNKFKAPTANQPVIVLVDNDDGMKSINSVLQQNFKKKPTGKEPFFHVKGNLYLIATPLKPGETESMIEDFFKEAIKVTVLDGKTFDPQKDADTDKHYSKHVFAQKVVKAQADTIDFSEFSSILSNMVLVIDEHAKKHNLQDGSGDETAKVEC